MTSITDGVWRLDPDRSSVEFHVPNFYGLMTVKGHFGRYDGTLDLSGQPAIELTIEAGSLETENKRRDKHLRSADFFDVESHPQVRFESDRATLAGEILKVRGRLHAAGKHILLDVDATLREVDGQLEIEAGALADHRELGMTWSPLGLLGAPSKLIVRGPLLRVGGPDKPATDDAVLAGAAHRARPRRQSPTRSSERLT
jgi:polyisoprenoid-binding protein YceI